jgi:hypothetical protein
MEREFSEAEKIGKLAEYVVAYYLRSLPPPNSHMVCHHGGEGEQEFEGRKLLTATGNLILPDLSWFKFEGSKQRFYWGDVKAKTYCTFHAHSQEWQTGCELECLDRYRWVSAATQKNCYIFFLQLRGDSSEGRCATGLFFKDTYALHKSNRAHVWRANGMIYWDIAALSLAADFGMLFAIPKCREYLTKIYGIIGNDARIQY